jgi:hypothetical protein
MAIITAEHLAHLNSFPKIADDGGAAWNLPKNLSLQDQLRSVIGDTSHHVGWQEYKMDLVRRLIVAGADPLVMESHSMHRAIDDHRDLWPADWAMSRPLRSCILGGCIAGSNSGVTSVILNTLFHKGDTIPEVLELADGTKINALTFASVMQSERITSQIIDVFSDFSQSKDPFSEAAEQAYLAAVKNNPPPKVHDPCLAIIMSLGMAGARLDPAFWKDKTFKSGNARYHLAGALIASNVVERSSVGYVKDFGKVLTWSEEMDRRSAVIAENLSMLKRNGITILGDKKPKASQMLHMAVASQLTACIPVLLEEGADPDAVNVLGQKPAMLKGVSAEIKGMLLSWKAHQAISAVLSQTKASASTSVKKP